MIISKRAKDAYVDKIKQESGNITYVYDEKHIDKRNKSKATRVANLSKSLTKLQSQLKKDITSNDQKTRLTALAIDVIDKTYERVGNTQSARDLKHYGVTTLMKKHLTFSGSKAIFNYIGKSGVKQRKEITDGKIVSALKEQVKNLKPTDTIFKGDGFTISAKHINKYLKPFNITAKDIRGMHANEEMIKELKKVRKGKLPSDEKEKEKKLKEEFEKALETAAERVGHEPATLKNQYLVPGLKDDYMKDGKINKLAMESNVYISKRAEDYRENKPYKFTYMDDLKGMPDYIIKLLNNKLMQLTDHLQIELWDVEDLNWGEAEANEICNALNQLGIPHQKINLNTGDKITYPQEQYADDKPNPLFPDMYKVVPAIDLKMIKDLSEEEKELLSVENINQDIQMDPTLMDLGVQYERLNEQEWTKDQAESIKESLFNIGIASKIEPV